MVNSDIDELPITTGGQSLFDIAQRSDTGYLEYRGQWVENASFAPDAKADRRRHKHFSYRLRSPPVVGGISMQKWTIVPDRCPEKAQWQVHFVTRMKPDPLSSLVQYRHFRAINNNWSDDRWRPEIPSADDYVADQELKEWLRVFDSEE